MGTDPGLDDAVKNRKAPSGELLSGAPSGALLFSVPEDFARMFIPDGVAALVPRSSISAEEPVRILTAHLALNGIVNPAERLAAFVGGAMASLPIKDLGHYKARPLNGIWATAPYLHNGSVPSLVHLLGVEPRPEKFCVGDRKYDIARVGYESYVSDAAQGKCPPGTSRVDTLKKGSSRNGHVYGNDLPVGDKKNLIEYLKSL
ncbi:MAG: hypothetical protein R2762_05095 [Bryobacteraceae bacterium]